MYSSETKPNSKKPRNEMEYTEKFTQFQQDIEKQSKLNKKAEQLLKTKSKTSIEKVLKMKSDINTLMSSNRLMTIPNDLSNKNENDQETGVFSLQELKKADMLILLQSVSDLSKKTTVILSDLEESLKTLEEEQKEQEVQRLDNMDELTLVQKTKTLEENKSSESKQPKYKDFK